MGKQAYTEARRDCNRRWDAENYKKMTVQADKDFLNEFCQMCDSIGISKNAAMKDAIALWMKENSAL